MEIERTSVSGERCGCSMVPQQTRIQDFVQEETTVETACGPQPFAVPTYLLAASDEYQDNQK